MHDRTTPVVAIPRGRLVQRQAAHYRRRRLDAHIRRRVRAIILRQKKRPRHLYRHLLARGVKPGTTAFRRRGVWNWSNRPGMTLAYRNHWFAGRLVSLAGEWQRFHAPRRVSGQAMLFDL